ncbi:hypothetical protein BCR42DRAFT_428577 [Absidia repens]|uniref:Uncharacterized protein n=1 Tax=Absidia repens TaxID=90262 RepID=A0A1X2HXY9_9FUNG|nr:hypothetical protein BCR42DRAFT_428577 [Absidia repens]
MIQFISHGVDCQVFLPTSGLLPTSSKPLPSPSPNPSPSPSPHPSPSPSPTSSFSPVIPISSSSSSSSLLPTSSSAPPPSSSSSSPPKTTIPSSTLASSSPSLSTPSSSSSATATPAPHKSESNIPTIVGAVVGGVGKLISFFKKKKKIPSHFFFVVGLALLGGLLTWLNRRGGCTSKTNQRKANFEDFGLAERDFPHHRSPAMTTNTALGGATMVASPTIPQLNDQGNYYNDGSGGKHYQQQQGYEQYHDSGGYYYPHEGGGGYDGNNGYDSHGIYEAHSGYDANGGYYDEHGYYYDGTTGQSINTGYEAMPPPSHQQVYHQQSSPSMDPQDIHKPNAANYR